MATADSNGTPSDLYQKQAETGNGTRAHGDPPAALKVRALRLSSGGKGAGVGCVDLLKTLAHNSNLRIWASGQSFLFPVTHEHTARFPPRTLRTQRAATIIL